MLTVEEMFIPLPEQVADAIPALVFYVDRERRHRFANPAYCEWFGRERERIEDQTLDEVLGAETCAAIRPHVDAALTGTPQQFEAVLPYARGGHRRVEVRYVPDRNDAGEVRGFYALAIDRGAADDHQRRMAEILDGFGDGFVALDFDWRIAYCNRAAEAHFNLRRDEALGRVFWDLMPEAVGGPLHTFSVAAMASRAPSEAEVPSFLRPGRWIALRAFPLETGLGVNFRDVTERRDGLAREREQAERLAEVERRHAFLLEVADTLRDIEDPEEIMSAAARLLGVRLNLARCGYAEIEEDGATLRVRGDWAPGHLPRLSRLAFALDAFGPEMVAVLRSGQCLCVDDVHEDPRSAPFAEAYAGVQIRAILGMPLIRNGRLDAFLCAASPEPRSWSPEDVTLAQHVAARTWSALARARSERALRESEARFRAMADCAPAPVWVTGAAGAMEFANQALAEFVGRPADELLGDIWIELMHPEDAPRVLAQRKAARAALSPYVFEARFRHVDGAWRWLRASSRPRFDAAGLFQGYVGLAMDVTATRRAEDRQQLLINELNHRVKNTLATVQSLTHQTLRTGVEAREARVRLTNRLLALSAAHNVLTRQNWEAAELSEIALEAVRPYDDPLVPRIALSGPAVRLSPNVALALSMALHELATNAVKYGSLSSTRGRVMLRWSLGPDGAAVALEWRETGGPALDGRPQRRGFGSRLLSQGLAAELGAPAEIEYPASGLVCRLRAPVAVA